MLLAVDLFSSLANDLHRVCVIGHDLNGWMQHQAHCHLAGMINLPHVYNLGA